MNFMKLAGAPPAFFVSVRIDPNGSYTSVHWLAPVAEVTLATEPRLS